MSHWFSFCLPANKGHSADAWGSGSRSLEIKMRKVRYRSARRPPEKFPLLIEDRREDLSRQSSDCSTSDNKADGGSRSLQDRASSAPGQHCGHSFMFSFALMLTNLLCMCMCVTLYHEAP